MESSTADPVSSAIASAGVTSEPSFLASNALAHSTPAAATHRTSAHSDDDESEQGLVIYDAQDSLSGPSTLTPSASGRLSASASRTSLDSVGFGYAQHLLPLSLSGADESYEDGEESIAYGTPTTSTGRGAVYGEREGGRISRGRRRRVPNPGRVRGEERRMGLIDGIALTVGLQIGSGPFSSPGVVTLNTGSIGASLVVWLVSGLMAWTGASSFAELGAAIPLNGGAQAYLNYSFGPLSAYLFAWTAIVALKPASASIIAIIFSEYVARVIYHTTSATAGDPHEQGLDGIPAWSIKLIACTLVVVISVLHAISTTLGTRAQVATTAVKLAALVAVPILAIVFSATGNMPEASKHAFKSLPNLFEGSSKSPSNYALALYSGLWAYDGWDQSTIVAGEIKNVTKNLPRVIHSSLAIVMVILLGTVTSYFLVLPPNLVKQTNTVALDFGSAQFGTAGGIFFALLVAFSCLGALNGQFYTSSRFLYTAAREGYLPATIGTMNARTRTPVNAIALQGVMVILFCLFGSGFASLVNFYGVCSWSGYLFTVLGLLMLRIKEPNLERPYQTWLVTPILFSVVALFLLFMPVFSAPLEAIAAAVFILAGIPMYFITQKLPVSSILGMCSCSRGAPSSAGVRKVDELRDEELEEEALEMLPSASREHEEEDDEDMEGKKSRESK